MLPSLRSPENFRERSLERVALKQGGSILAFLLVVTIGLVVTYIRSEHTIYWWDYTTYSLLLEKKFTDLQSSPLAALRSVWRSAGSDYGDYPLLLLLPFRWAFGGSRLVYVLSVALVYLVPFALVLASVAATLIPSVSPKTVRWITVLIAIATPLFWAPTLRGYVDVGAALLVTLAIRVYLQDITLRHRWQICAIGVLLGFAPLFRRHFAYAGIAFFAAMILQAAVRTIPLWRQDLRSALRLTVASALRIGAVAIVSVSTLAVLGPRFILVALRNDFGSLYSSYEVPVSQGLQYFGTAYGWVACLLAALGFAIGFRKRFLSSPAASFIVSFYSVLFLLWINKVKQVGVHYTAHFTALIVLGLVALTWAIVQQRSRLLPLGILGLYLCLNFWIGLAPVQALDQTPLRPTRTGMSFTPAETGTSLSELFAANNPPLRRTDYDELARLVQTLRTIAPHKEPIYLGAASELLNSNLLIFSEETLYHERSLNILSTQDIDSRDRYPIEAILQAKYVITATPFQHQLRPQDQDIVKVVGDIFSDGWQVSKDFTRLPLEFRLAKGVTVDLYQRQRSTSLGTAIATLDAIKGTVGSPRPGQQPDWIVTDRTPSYDLWKVNGVTSMQPRSESSSSSTSLLHINSLSKPSAEVTGKITYNDRQCPGIKVSLRGLDRSAQTVHTAALDHSPTATADFSLPMSTEKADYLLLEFSSKVDTPTDIKRCAITVSRLQVSSK